MHLGLLHKSLTHVDRGIPRIVACGYHLYTHSVSFHLNQRWVRYPFHGERLKMPPQKIRFWPRVLIALWREDDLRRLCRSMRQNLADLRPVMAHARWFCFRPTFYALQQISIECYVNPQWSLHILEPVSRDVDANAMTMNVHTRSVPLCWSLVIGTRSLRETVAAHPFLRGPSSFDWH